MSLLNDPGYVVGFTKTPVPFVDYRPVTTCRLCDSARLLEVLNLGDTPLANELDGTELFPLVMMRCDDCGHHQLSIAVAPARLWGPNYPYQSGTSPVFRAHLEKLADEVAAMKPGGRVLEIASNDGTLVEMLAERRMKPIGIDPSGPIKARETYRLRQLSWPTNDGQYGMRGPFDVIIALNVFAHVDDLHGFTAAVKEALAPDGVFIVEVGYLTAMCFLGVFDTVYHEHMSYHTVAPLQKFFRRHGLWLNRASFNASQGGSLRCYVHHDQQSPDLLASDTPDVSKLRERITLTQAGMDMAHKPSLNRAGYGCPAKLTTLMYALHLPPLDCIFDDNPLKVGRTTPGMNIPIVPTSELLTRNPDTLILFSWNFAIEIIPRLRAMGYRGRIVTPLPEVEVDEL